MPAAYYDFFRKIVLQPDNITLEADSTIDTLTITGGAGVALNPNATNDSFEIDVDYQLYVPIGTTEIRLNDVNSNHTGVSIVGGSNVAVGRNNNNEITITTTVGGTSKAISNISQTTPAIVTTTNAHSFTEGIAVTITDVTGMTQVNGNEYFMNILTSTTFALYEDADLTTALNSTGFTAYSSGGVATAEYGAPQSLTQLSDVDFVSDPPVNGSYLQYNGNFWGIGSTLSGDFIGSVFADDSTLLVDGVNGVIPKANVESSTNWDTAYGWGDHSTEGYLTSVAFGDLTTTPTTLAGYGITDAATTAQGALADTALQIGDVFDVKGSVFGDDSTLLVDGVNSTIPASVLSGVRANQWDLSYTWGDHSLAGYLTTASNIDDVLTAGNSTSLGISVGSATVGGLFLENTTLDTSDSSAITVTPSVNFDTTINVSDVIPSVDSAIDVGSDANKFRAIYADNFNTGVGGFVNAQYVRIGPDDTYAGMLYPQTTNAWTWGGYMDPGNIFHNRSNTYVRWKSTGQLVSSRTNPSGTVDVDFLASDTHYFYQPTGALTVNFTNIPTSASRMYNMRIYIAQGATAYVPTSVQINGVADTIEWQNGVIPTGSANSIDFIQFLVWSFGGGFVVLGQSNSYV